MYGSDRPVSRAISVSEVPAAQGPGPKMRFGQGALQNLVRRGNGLARDDPVLISTQK